MSKKYFIPSPCLSLVLTKKFLKSSKLNFDGGKASRGSISVFFAGAGYGFGSSFFFSTFFSSEGAKSGYKAF